MKKSTLTLLHFSKLNISKMPLLKINFRSRESSNLMGDGLDFWVAQKNASTSVGKSKKNTYLCAPQKMKG